MEKERRHEGLPAIYKEIATIAREDVSEEEFEKALGNISGSTQMGIETSQQLAGFIGNQLLYKDDIMTLPQILKKYEALSPADLSIVAQRLLKDKLWTYWIE
jgi:predicted Zn-dependent peptidase